MEIDLGLSNRDRMPKKTPTEMKKLLACRLFYEDGSELELPIEDEQGFHRVNSYVRNGRQLTIHEVFITYGKSDTL